MNAICRAAPEPAASSQAATDGARAPQKGRTLAGPPFRRGVRLAGYEQPEVVPQLTHLWQLPLGIMIDPHSGQVGASVRAMKL